MRVGIVGANPPVAMQRMLGLKSDFAYEPDAEQAKQLVGRRFFLVSGGETDIQVSQPYAACTLNLFSAGATEPLQFENAVCKFRMQATRLQDGWVQLEFVPQVSYGDDSVRTVVGDTGWRYQNGQQTETFFLHTFQRQAGNGRHGRHHRRGRRLGNSRPDSFSADRRPCDRRAVVDEEAGDGEQPAPPPVHEHPIQRLLIIRLAGMEGSEPLHATGR